MKLRYTFLLVARRQERVQSFASFITNHRHSEILCRSKIQLHHCFFSHRTAYVIQLKFQIWKTSYLSFTRTELYDASSGNIFSYIDSSFSTIIIFSSSQGLFLRWHNIISFFFLFDFWVISLLTYDIKINFNLMTFYHDKISFCQRTAKAKRTRLWSGSIINRGVRVCMICKQKQSRFSRFPRGTEIFDGNIAWCLSFKPHPTSNIVILYLSFIYTYIIY